MAKQHALARISEEGQTPVTASPIVQQMAPALQAKGLALATTVINEASGQAGAWGRYYRDLLELSPEGRKAFRSGIAAATAKPKEMRGKNPTMADFDETAKASQRSAKTRLSEFVQITKALDAGIEFSAKWAFHYAVGFARTALASKSAIAETRGRKAKPALDKVREYIAKHAPEIGGLEAVAALVDEMIHTPEPEAEKA